MWLAITSSSTDVRVSPLGDLEQRLPLLADAAACAMFLTVLF